MSLSVALPRDFSIRKQLNVVPGVPTRPFEAPEPQKDALFGPIQITHFHLGATHHQPDGSRHLLNRWAQLGGNFDGAEK